MTKSGSHQSSGGLGAALSGEIVGDSEKRRDPKPKKCACGTYINSSRRRAGKDKCGICEHKPSNADEDYSAEMHALYTKSLDKKPVR